MLRTATHRARVHDERVHHSTSSLLCSMGNVQDTWAVFMSHTYAMSVKSPMSDIAVINHSDCKNVYAWVTHRISHSYVRSTATT